MARQNAQRIKVLIVSDIHYASAAERARGSNYELATIKSPWVRLLAAAFRHQIWMSDPFARNPHLGLFLEKAEPADLVVVNGDLTADSGFIGLADPAALESAVQCIGRLRAKFGECLHLVIGDHDLGKKTMFSGSGSMRLASWQAITGQLGIPPLWQLNIGNYRLISITSPLLALPAHHNDALPQEWGEWQRLRELHLAEIREVFEALQPEHKVILFCHDPTALPFLGELREVNRRLSQIEQTIIGHLHTELVLWKSWLLSGIPPTRILGQSVFKITSALHKADGWRPFKLRLCPALAGIELLNDGGYYSMALDPEAKYPAQFTFRPLPR